LFGVTGTIVGAALVAVISTTGSAIYSASMRRTSNQLRRARESLLMARAGQNRSGSTAPFTWPSQSRAGGRSSALGRATGGTAESGIADGADEPSGPGWLRRWRRGWLTVGSRRGLRWQALVGAAVLVFAIAIGAVTAFEAIAKEPVSALTGGGGSGTTTIGSLTGDSSRSTPTPTPSATSTSSSKPGSGSASRSATPSPSASASARTSAPASQAPAPSASAAPSSAPQGNSAGSGSSGSGGSGGGSTGGSGSGQTAPLP
jgi:hypothetical protein